MPKNEKKSLLSGEMIERMIRVEQRVSASFNEHVPYNKTEYYKSLSKKEKIDFEKYLRRKGRRSSAIFVAILLALLLIVVLKVELTGNAVKEKSGIPDFSKIEILLMLFVLIAILISIISFIVNKKRERKLENKFDVLDSLGLKRHIINLNRKV